MKPFFILELSLTYLKRNYSLVLIFLRGIVAVGSPLKLVSRKHPRNSTTLHSSFLNQPRQRKSYGLMFAHLYTCNQLFSKSVYQFFLKFSNRNLETKKSDRSGFSLEILLCLKIRKKDSEWSCFFGVLSVLFARSNLK